MEKILHVLAIDDHAVVLEGYNAIFKSMEDETLKLNFTKASDCKSGCEVIDAHRKSPFDIAVIDYSIPQYKEKNLFSGEDMALLVRELMPDCRVVMMTMHKEVEIMGSILQKVKPDGFINKSDCDTEQLIKGFRAVISGENYFSTTVQSYIKRMEKGIVLEDVDVRILVLLAKGVKNKNLDKYIPLTGSAIEKRKYKIKRMLEVTGSDEDLINTARNQGYI